MVLIWITISFYTLRVLNSTTKYCTKMVNFKCGRQEDAWKPHLYLNLGPLDQGKLINGSYRQVVLLGPISELPVDAVTVGDAGPG